MRKIFVICGLLYSIGVFSQLYITQQEAAKIATMYMESHYDRFRSKAYADTLENTKDNYNVQSFSISGKSFLYKVEFYGGGWALVSPYKQMEPILAVNESEAFPDMEDMPEGMKWLFSYYEYVAANIIETDTMVHPNWHNYYERQVLTRSNDVKISAFDDIKWGQGYNNTHKIDGFYCNRKYNKYCPNQYFTPQCGHTYVGCGAVAMGQVMKYYQWPEYAMVPDSIITDTLHKSASFPSPMTFRESFYDWDIIPNALYRNSTVQKEDAIALFLRDCGYSAKMYYGETGSKTYASYVVNALKTYFGYSSSIQSVSRSSYNDNEFIALLKNEIDNQRPVLYSGSGYKYNVNYTDSTLVGHMFILYGYNNEDKFYINWGFNGSYQNTAFSLNVLKPYTQSPIYQYYQNAVINVYPDYCTPQKVNPDESWSQSFTKQYVGNIEIGNRTISANQQGTVTAANSIRLTNGLIIEQGADVIMSIEGTSCGDLPAVANYLMPDIQQEKYQNGVLSLNRKIISKPMDVMRLSVRQMDNILLVECDSKLTQISIYDISGRPVYQVFEHEINISHLPEGLYILQAQTTDGEMLQGKFIHSR